MSYVSETIGYTILIIFGIVMLLATYVFARWNKWNTKDGFLVANRNVGWLLGGTSIAASWIWAPALFISTQIAYQQGLAGIFWFTFPNVIALAIFAFLAPKIREKFSQGYTLPQFIKYKLGSKKVHKVYLFPYVFYQLMAVSVQLFAGGSFISLLTGISLIKIMPILLIIALVYTLISGLEASIVTDLFQIITIFGIGIIVIPMVLSSAGGLSIISSGLAGIKGSTNIFNPGIAFSFGIVTSIGLIAGAICDQQYWQRSFAIKKKDLRKAFLFGAVLFAIVPIALSLLGFIAANSNLGVTLPEGIDASMIGVQTVTTLLPQWAVLLFVIMLLCGLSSTLDSGLSAFSSLWVTDIVKKESDKNAIKSARFAMIGLALFGLIIAIAVNYIPNFGLQHLWWIFNAVAACVVVPTILSLYWDRLTAKGVYYGILTAFIIGLPIFVYGNIVNSTIIIVCSNLFMIIVSVVFCLVYSKKTVRRKEDESRKFRCTNEA